MKTILLLAVISSVYDKDPEGNSAFRDVMPTMERCQLIKDHMIRTGEFRWATCLVVVN